MAARCKTAILISGSGTNLQAFIDRVGCGALDLELCVVFSNKPDAYGLVRARDAGIPTACIEHGQFADRSAFDRAVAAKLDEWRPNLLVLAGFMRILSPDFLTHYAGRILNIHPALLPAYPGLNTHQRVLDAGDRWHGSTVHFVTEKLDGGPRILQGRLPVTAGETADQLAARVQAIEHQIYPEAAGWVGEGRVEFRDDRTWIDGVMSDEPVIRMFDRRGKRL
ncbi:MAG: phosphoribosylglycinamide formyltransferase [Gammaproteobacteria bacterium]|nr:phosphoribosylglycinamide formyltransferase [Gammaproteobacteria bacterium]